MTKLTPRQREILTMLASGWQIGHGLNSHVWAQQGGAARGGQSINMRISTFLSLREKGLIECTDERYPTHRYDISKAGRLALVLESEAQ